MNYRKSYGLLLFSIWVGAALTFLGLYVGAKGLMIGNVIALIGVLLMILGLWQAIFFYKCPVCHRRFNIRGKKVEYCPGCGQRLDWE